MLLEIIFNIITSLLRDNSALSIAEMHSFIAFEVWESSPSLFCAIEEAKEEEDTEDVAEEDDPEPNVVEDNEEDIEEEPVGVAEEEDVVAGAPEDALNVFAVGTEDEEGLDAVDPEGEEDLDAGAPEDEEDLDAVVLEDEEDLDGVATEDEEDLDGNFPFDGAAVAVAEDLAAPLAADVEVVEAVAAAFPFVAAMEIGNIFFFCKLKK